MQEINTKQSWKAIIEQHNWNTQEDETDSYFLLKDPGNLATHSSSFNKNLLSFCCVQYWDSYSFIQPTMGWVFFEAIERDQWISKTKKKNPYTHRTYILETWKAPNTQTNETHSMSESNNCFKKKQSWKGSWEVSGLGKGALEY